MISTNDKSSPPWKKYKVPLSRTSILWLWWHQQTDTLVSVSVQITQTFLCGIKGCKIVTLYRKVRKRQRGTLQWSGGGMCPVACDMEPVLFCTWRRKISHEEKKSRRTVKMLSSSPPRESIISVSSARIQKKLKPMYSNSSTNTVTFLKANLKLTFLAQLLNEYYFFYIYLTSSELNLISINVSNTYVYLFICVH